MSNSSVQTAPGLTGSAPASPLAEKKPHSRSQPAWWYRNLLVPLASLRLTVVLFALSLLLVFFGTMAQIDVGIGTVMKQYFRWFYVWVPYQLLVQFGQVFFGVSRELKVNGGFPFPAGWTLGALLLANLLAAHMVRFKVSWKRSGILLIHAGLIVLMLGELFTGLFAVEQKMTIGLDEAVAFTDVSDQIELALATPDKEDASKDQVVVIPDRMIRKVGQRIHNDQLPVDVEVVEFMKNSNLIERSRKRDRLPNQRFALDFKPYGVANESESSGVDTEMTADTPSARVAFYRKGTDEKLGELFVSLWYYPNHIRRIVEFAPQTISVDGTTYTVDLRPRREYKDYSLTLREFRHDVYEGTDKAKNFSSLVSLADADGQRREVKIYMNNPLRYNGETFFQSAYFQDNSGTILQVVRNPAWLMPYVSCIIVTLGMLIHFGISLSTFLSRRTSL